MTIYNIFHLYTYVTIAHYQVHCRLRFFSRSNIIIRYERDSGSKSQQQQQHSKIDVGNSISLWFEHDKSRKSWRPKTLAQIYFHKNSKKKTKEYVDVAHLCIYANLYGFLSRKKNCTQRLYFVSPSYNFTLISPMHAFIFHNLIIVHASCLVTMCIYNL